MNLRKQDGAKMVAGLGLAILSLLGENQAAQWPWLEPQAEVTTTGDLKWKPQAFQATVNSARYIDYESGNDNNTGTSQSQAWKHHPWDPAATGNAKAASGVHTYVFKKGVIYRGELRADESGNDNSPIQLTSIQGWGSGEAMFYGSEKVTGTWVQGAHASMSDETGIWHTDLTFAPRRVFMADNGAITPINLARTPNWKVSDPDDVKSEWWKWQAAGSMNIDGKPVVRGKDPANLTKPADYYMDAIIYAEGKPIMGLPTPSRVINFDATNNMITFNDPFSSWGAMGVQGDCSYYLEDKPHFLDSPGEFWFDKNGDGGRLYVRLPGNRNPNQVHIEAAKRLNLVVLDGQSNIHISNIAFRFTNVYWVIDQHLGVDDVRCAVILQHPGQGRNITVRNCKFEHVNQAFRMEGYSGAENDLVQVSDNEINYTDHAAVDIKNRGEIHFLRNKISEIVLHPYAGDNGGGGVGIGDAEITIVAGNIVHRTYSIGLKIHPDHGAFRRTFVYHNKVTDAMLNARDWGALEIWDGNHAIVFSNIVGNPGPGGNWAPGYYYDGSPSKIYLFNNIGWGKIKNGKYTNHTALQQIWGFENVVFNNTFFRYENASNRQRSEPQRNQYIGNLILDMDEFGFKHTRVSGFTVPNPTHAGEPDTNYDYQTAGYANNIFYKPPKKLAAFDSKGNYFDVAEAFNNSLAHYKTLCSNGAKVVATDPVKDAEGHDFQLTDNSPAINQGAKVFVPFPLYMVIGEYNFHRNNTDPKTIIDAHWYHAPYYPDRTAHRYMPRFPLKGENITAGNYVKGTLEDWTTSVLTLNGSNQYAHLAHADMKKDIVYPKGLNGNETGKVYGRYVVCADMEKNNFLLEAYLKVDPNKSGLIVGKADAAGYVFEVDNNGKARLRLRSGGADVAKRSSSVAINDGKWHHVIAEVNRSAAQGIKIYVDGKDASGTFEGTMPSASVSLSTTANLLVGGGPGQQYLTGGIDFLRISRGTLADAKTTIEELYDWQFVKGLHLRDFAWKEIEDKARDAGAFEGKPTPIAVANNPVYDEYGMAAKSVVTTLKAAAESGVRTAMLPEGNKGSVNVQSYADSTELLLNGTAASVSDTIVVPVNGNYTFTVASEKGMIFKLYKITGTGLVIEATSGVGQFLCNLTAGEKYLYNVTMTGTAKKSECTIGWQLFR